MASYRFGRKIGSGGFAEVLECTRVEDNAVFAVKRLLSLDPEHTKRFAREVRMQATLSHPNILPILGQNLTKTPPWALLPRAKGNMRDLMPLHPGENGAWMVLQSATGLMHAHANGVVHRDLKPENVLYFVDRSGSVRLCVADFGLGRFMNRDSTEITLVNMGLGTLAYMAPEQFTDAANSDHRADIYALGKMLYEVLTGLVPYPSIDIQLVPASFRYIVQKATQTDKLKRYQSVEAFVKDLTIAVEQPDRLAKPSESIKSFLRAHGALTEIGFADAEKLARIFIENLDDTSVMLTELPQLPDEAIVALCTHRETDLVAIIKAYDVQVSGGVSFTYCDTAADFLARVWNHCLNAEVRGLVLTRLAEMGAYNNRWHVGHVLERIVGRTDGSDPALLALRDALQGSDRVREFNRPYLLKAGVPRIVRDVLGEE